MEKYKDVASRGFNLGNGTKILILNYVGDGDPIQRLNEAVSEYVSDEKHSVYVDPKNPRVKIVVKGNNSASIVDKTERPEIKDYKNYTRFPIQLSSHDIMLIHLFRNDSSLETMFEMVEMNQEHDEAMVKSYKQHEEAAEQFFNQLEGHYSDAFLKAMVVKATKLLAKSDKRMNELTEKLHEKTGRPKDKKQQRAIEALEEARKYI